MCCDIFSSIIYIALYCCVVFPKARARRALSSWQDDVQDVRCAATKRFRIHGIPPR